MQLISFGTQSYVITLHVCRMILVLYIVIMDLRLPWMRYENGFGIGDEKIGSGFILQYAWWDIFF